MVGQTLGHYKILDKLGAGGMGEVYRAEDTTLDREVALKILPPELAESQERLDRFQREAKALAALDHPNIVHIHTVEEVDGVHFLTMQLVEGKPLSRLISKGGMPLERIFEIAIPLADALATAHEKGVIHRDLKPANIMVTGEGRVKVLDFGLAKLRQEAEIPLATELPTEPLTEEGKIVGTMPYMSPEQLEGKEIDARSDVFSLGVVLYEMATGERPFKGDSTASLITAIMGHSPREVDSLRAELPHHLSRIIRQCLEKEPEDRRQSAKDVRNELRDLHREESSSAAVPAAPAPKPEPTKNRVRWPLVAVTVLVLAVVLALWLVRSQPPSEPPAEPAAAVETQPPKLVVLPFENLGNPEDEYFADGMTEEITSRLAVVSGLRVISRTSAMQYKEDRPSLKQVGEELGVDYVLEGTVRWAPSDGSSRVRITPQLIHVEDDTHLWADSYDRVIEDVFAIQSDIASKVVEQLDVTLLEPEREVIETRPTENLEAYQAYLRGKHLEGLPDYTSQHREKIIDAHRLATELDPYFAVAHAALAHAHSFYFRLGYDRTETRRHAAWEAVERAMTLGPESPRVLHEVGYFYYYVEQDYAEALEKFAAAAAILPGDADILSASAYVWRRQGMWEEALARLEEAFKLSPRDAQMVAQMGEFAMDMREYPLALQHFDNAIDLAPDVIWPYSMKFLTLILWRGDLAGSRGVLEALPAPSEEHSTAYLDWYDQSRLERQFDKALELLEAMPSEWFRSQRSAFPIDLLKGQTHLFLGDHQSALVAFEAARIAIEEVLQHDPDDFRLHSALGRTYAGLGRKDEAVREGRKAVDLQPVSKDAYIGPRQLINLAEVYTWTGELDQAVAQLDHLLSIPSSLSVPWLRLDPRWDPLRDHPRFQALLEKYGEEG